MIVHLPQVIPTDEAAKIVRAIESEDFVSGERTAGENRTLKRNQELSPQSEVGKRLQSELKRKLLKNKLFLNLAMPKRIGDCLLSRYVVGMSYSDHIDNTIMKEATGDPMRADLSMTLFLDKPETYDGGELVLNSDTAPQKVKLPAGDAVLYPTSNYHRVEPVTRGVRHALIFWIQSMVRSAERREILTEMWIALDALHRQESARGEYQTQAITVLKKARANLYRMWADV